MSIYDRGPEFEVFCPRSAFYECWTFVENMSVGNVTFVFQWTQKRLKRLCCNDISEILKANDPAGYVWDRSGNSKADGCAGKGRWADASQTQTEEHPLWQIENTSRTKVILCEQNNSGCAHKFAQHHCHADTSCNICCCYQTRKWNGQTWS